MKDYKKIYFRLKKLLKDDLKLYIEYIKKFNPTHISDVMDYHEMRTSIRDTQNLLLIMEEIEGKKHRKILMTQSEFKKWRKKIKQ